MGFFRFLKALVCNQVFIGSVAILAFCLALALAGAVLSWLHYRDQYGISLADFFQVDVLGRWGLGPRAHAQPSTVFAVLPGSSRTSFGSR